MCLWGDFCVCLYVFACLCARVHVGIKYVFVRQFYACLCVSMCLCEFMHVCGLL